MPISDQLNQKLGMWVSNSLCFNSPPGDVVLRKNVTVTVKLELDRPKSDITENRCDHDRIEKWESPVKKMLTPFLYSSLQRAPSTAIFAL